MINSVLHNKFTLLPAFGLILLMVASMQVYAEGDKVEWGTSIEDAQSQAAESGKSIMMDFYTDW